ncbi:MULTISPECIES: hypothetical protein [Streptomyces]|uniref:Uncharacterized protein n=1 Tax=Streptomyces solicathayae TaxID=3081768 RepID=A0ABZ0LYE1_9ACTN|nr:hypothetical protein [Streptomyces sp. HUAS YS2]WOX23803.1 hypothetical protein R2D22_21420 [Streptomyces sp. HUAS YS2]
MTRTKRFLACFFLAATVAAGTATPALADQHVTDVDGIHVTVVDV